MQDTALKAVFNTLFVKFGAFFADPSEQYHLGVGSKSPLDASPAERYR